MTMHLVTPPAVEPVALAEARAYLRLTTENEDAVLAGLLKTARETVESQAGLALINQTWRLHVDRWPRSGRLALYRFPVQSVTQVTVYGADGTPSILDGGEWSLQAGRRPARLYLGKKGDDRDELNGLEVDFIAGFGATGADVPEALRQAILVLTAHMFEFRGAFDGAAQPVDFPPAFTRLVDIWRRVSV